ncbi:DUF4330 domain-containing protein [Pelotomaculum terephthalicicum JT]|uniref:DUF4330 domain-containing protein n=1 Tax=Pelotomaculum TaxID=191373 RepID=UPI0009C75A0A|nr:MULTISPECIES: DUF4330 domain-containing protein [Pelotomaculum]MCG9966452.1 DUF4330 domain-containing protein [Pelotomaculum terephthalicicum JT]OPX89187.1 MAG: hypothetical protein A4E54_01065 [Pelotomaculum sp. PtaB.Bin117]OPY63407.1 MAG: hypothetical protein A4E56_00629 [Pelotomaculum sp. PtaU1.Bin065]
MHKKKDNVKFNFVDIIIIGLILALFAAGVYKLAFVNRALALQNGHIEFKVYVEKVRIPTAESIKEGQAVRDVQTNIPLGNVVKKEVFPYQEAVPTLDGRVVLADVPEKYDVIITIESPAVVTDNTIMIGNKEIKIGAQINVKSNVFSVNGTIYGATILNQ